MSCLPIPNVYKQCWVKYWPFVPCQHILKWNKPVNVNKSTPVSIGFLIAGLENKYFLWKSWAHLSKGCQLMSWSPSVSAHLQILFIFSAWLYTPGSLWASAVDGGNQSTQQTLTDNFLTCLTLNSAWAFGEPQRAVTANALDHSFSHLTLMLLVANLANSKWCQQTSKNDWNHGTRVLIWEHSEKDTQWISTSSWQGLHGFQKSLRLCTLGQSTISSLSIGRVKLNSTWAFGEPQRAISANAFRSPFFSYLKRFRIIILKHPLNFGKIDILLEQDLLIE